MATEGKRTCSKCGIEKPLTWFPRSKSARLGRDYYCKKCHREKAIQYAKDNPEKVRAAWEKHNAKDREYNNVRASLADLEMAVEAYDEYDV